MRVLILMGTVCNWKINNNIVCLEVYLTSNLVCTYVGISN